MILNIKITQFATKTAQIVHVMYLKITIFHCGFPGCIYSLVILVFGSSWRIPWLSLQNFEQVVN